MECRDFHWEDLAANQRDEELYFFVGPGTLSVLPVESSMEMVVTLVGRAVRTPLKTSNGAAATG